jgi:hypothetical protein
MGVFVSHALDVRVGSRLCVPMELDERLEEVANFCSINDLVSTTVLTWTSPPFKRRLKSRRMHSCYLERGRSISKTRLIFKHWNGTGSVQIQTGRACEGDMLMLCCGLHGVITTNE